MVEGTGFDVDQDFPRPRLRVRYLAELENVGSSVLVKTKCFHDLDFLFRECDEKTNARFKTGMMQKLSQ
jgi:hypothetical protein